MVSSPRTDLEQMEEVLSNRLKTVGGYKHGSIKRIKLTRFLTYNAVEFCPGPRLNMVVGPNGSGKSSILCAICLGLGGEPRLLGRADKVESFIQNGETEAEIELEVANEHGDNVVVTRTITIHDSYESKKNKNKSSVFTWNGEVVSGKKVRERAAADFQIQLDNLCTFLPQEKVGNFSGISSTDLLLETEKTLSDNQDLYNTHMKLIKIQEDLQGGDNQVDTLKQKVEQLQAEVKQYKAGVDRLQERIKAEEHADLLRKKILWLQVDAIQEECRVLKAEKETVKKQYEELHIKLEPLEQDHNAAIDRLKVATKEIDKFDKQIKKHEKDMDKHKTKYHNADDKIDNLEQDISSIESTRAKNEADAKRLSDKVDEEEAKLAQKKSMEELQEELSKARQDQEATRKICYEKKSEKQKIHRKLTSVNEEISTERRKLDRLQNEKEQRRMHVLRQFQDVKKSYDWIQQNRNAFRKEVIGPIACEISPKSLEAATYLEQHVPNSTLKSFVVQNKSDYDLLYQKIRVEQSIPINIITVDRISQNESRVYSEGKMAMLKREHGVMGYLDESFEGPDIVVEALKANASIQKVLVGNDETQNSLDSRGLGDILSQSEKGGPLQSYCIFASRRGQSFKYTSQISRYSGKPSLRVDDIKPAKMLSRGASDDAKQRVIQKLEEKQKQKNELQPKFEQLESECNELERERDHAQSIYINGRHEIQELQKSQARLKNAKGKLKAAKKQLENNDDEKKKSIKDDLKKCVRILLTSMTAHSASHKLMMEAKVKSSGAQINKEIATGQEITCSEKVYEVGREIEQVRNNFSRVKEKFNETKKKYKEFNKNALNEAPLEDAEGNHTVLWEKLTNDLGQFESVFLAEAALEEANEKIQGIHADPNVLRLYEEKSKELEETQEDLDDLTDRKEKRVSELERMREPWFETLKKTIETVDKRFTMYMSELGCVGFVSLKYENDLNFSFKDYAVEIKVSFRAKVEPSVLSSRVQSGGERSVSTIMYLMAMQDMMVSPFRCVDEINQGLDDRNERLVFKRIVENSCREPGEGGPTDHCGQYWLITPKLLPNLIDMEVAAMNVICIFNGPYTLKNPTDWCTEKLVEIGKRRRELFDSDGDSDEDDDNTRKSPRIGD
eukprot:CAMPEP_0116132262 /NCGR_PEP_ID=MMETSP0329-20121206/9453_1 /TAXON_ID=697910 /ORGANISM="Pseudo-nitzschia arenysensis, Strain B593" /LENGTH=1129 /DNA_ID=CAMNT_0003626763 /DNA_START=129 /DNA_END=3518 /DNA_ORIENTATION=+